AWPSDWSAAGALVERMAKMGISLEIVTPHIAGGPFDAAAWDSEQGRYVTEDVSELTGPHAIALACRDALRARAPGGQHGA
ncbi:MAG TPA: hypothetical protein VFS44_02275, partial [Gemmatimonadaceae bacterium]|nr:hypothetical protein [Gemmatimonadaceae bacterium]